MSGKTEGGSRYVLKSEISKQFLIYFDKGGSDSGRNVKTRRV